ncbi:MAG: HipA domain-containing protein [Gallionella sp.]|nr:HipA domain-containing protein [Gallionella sp.]
MTSDLYVWMFLPGEYRPVVAGRLSLSLTPAGRVGRFVYGKSYLSNKNAIPIDPVALPTHGNIEPFLSLGGYPGAIMDSCPDRWGIKVINRLLGEQPYPDGYILLNDPGRVGCLAFSTSADTPPEELASREFELEDLLRASQLIERNQAVDDELLRALHPGTGGARPKCNITDKEAVWIAKFPSADDPVQISTPRLEHASMTLAKLCGINAAETRLLSVNGSDICLVRRFDRVVKSDGIARLGYLSARTVFNSDPDFQRFKIASYARLSRWLSRFGTSPDGRAELYRRMVFNCSVRNTDDHELNHGLVFDPQCGYVLSPAFDIVPQMVPHRIYHHAMMTGETAAGTFDNMLSACAAFGLEKDQAVQIIYEIQSLIKSHWQDVFYECGCGEEEIRYLERYFSPVPLTGD